MANRPRLYELNVYCLKPPVWGSTPAAGNLSQFNQPPRSTQPGHPFVGRRNEYRSKGGDALRLRSKGRWCCLQITLYDPYLRALEAFAWTRYTNRRLLLLLLKKSWTCSKVAYHNRWANGRPLMPPVTPVMWVVDMS